MGSEVFEPGFPGLTSKTLEVQTNFISPGPVIRLPPHLNS